MLINVNGRSIEIFSGAKVGDVLRRYSRAEWTRVRRGETKVCDRHGHEVGLDGELIGGEELITSARVPEEPPS
ncbi:MAG: hypothetical protein NTZ26_01590 [Candidatus Aminicenantes bacterium]|nr:hypothetical protein [Candidatus Aminicenantes bacterium]